jgi:hypothetical protein
MSSAAPDYSQGGICGVGVGTPLSQTPLGRLNRNISQAVTRG